MGLDDLLFGKKKPIITIDKVVSVIVVEIVLQNNKD